MLVKLALSGHASPEALSKFERIKAYVPDSAPVLVTYFNKQVGGVSKSMLKKSRLNFDKIEKCK
ncbi:hypothetical protein [Acinetobacter sp. AGC35]